MEIEIEEFLSKEIKDEVFIIETDTVYGIGCLMTSIAGAKRIMELKNRSESKFFSLLVSNMDQVRMLTKNHENSMDLMRKYWPGGLTIIFKKSDIVKDYISKSDTVGLRMPNDKATLSVLEKFGPMIMTSLNKSGEPPIVKYSDCLKWKDDVDYLIKGPDLSGIPSTVYDNENKKVLRQGSVSIEEK